MHLTTEIDKSPVCLS